MKRADYFTKTRGGVVNCRLCPWKCKIPKGETGHCNTRINYEGVLHSLVYGEPTGLQVDPIEKKPFFHFHPGSRVLSFGTQGCNFRCEYCCNYYYSQASPDTTTVVRVSPEDIVKKALMEKCGGIAYTYNEPSIFFEYAFDTAKLAHKKGLFNVFVTNGCINKEPVMDIDPYLDAVVIDFKGFNPDFYKKYVHAKLEWVKNGTMNYSKTRAHKEVTNLVVPGLNDDKEDIRKLARFVIDTFGANTPLHLLRFFPLYKMSNVIETPLAVLEDCCDIAKQEGLRYTYIGNADSDCENTYCPYCKELLIKRSRSRIIKSRIVNNRCPKCDERIPINDVKEDFNHRPYFG